MKYAEPHIKKALIALLQVGVPVREGYASDKPEQITLEGFTNANRDNAQTYNQEWTFSLEVVVKTTATGGSSLRAQQITAEVLQQIPSLQLPPESGLQLLNKRLVNVVPLKDMGDTGPIHRRVITFSFRIHQL